MVKIDCVAYWKRLLKHTQDVQEFKWMIAWNVGVGLSWLCGAKGRSTGHAYDAARAIGTFLPGYPLRWFGALMLILVGGFIVASILKHDKLIAVALQLLAGYWFWWTAMYAYGVLNGGGLVAAILAGAFTRRHYKLRASLLVP